MGLEPLEFSDCLTDSPIFRNKLHEHEKELEGTSKAIKTLITDGKDLLNASRQLAKAQKQFSQSLIGFKFECIGQQQTDDETLIAGALKEFGQLMMRIEDERERMLEKGHDQLIKPLENFRKIHIGQAKEGKKAFDKQTQKFCASLERYLNLKTKVPDNQLQEADAQLDMERRGFYEQSMKYVLQLQEVQERKKFEFVEILLAFVQSLLTFYHEGYDTYEDYKQYIPNLQHTLQKTRENFMITKEQAEKLMLKMLENRTTCQSLGDMSMMRNVDQTGMLRGNWTRQGYLYLMEKKALANSWTKYWCCYRKDDKKFFMVLFNQVTGKMMQPACEIVSLESCVRRASDSIDRRFCMDLTVTSMMKSSSLTFQALSEEDRKLWMDVMDGKEPLYNKPHAATEDTSLDDRGFKFMRNCINAIESNGLDDQGLYRVVGVSSKVSKLIQQGLEGKLLDLSDPMQYEIKTVTSAIKQYLRTLPEPLMTFKLHPDFMNAAKRDSLNLRLMDIHTLVHKLPPCNFEMLELLIAHLRRIAKNSDKNLMTIANLGVCFGPTLMRPEEETVAAIMDIKFCNIVIEILIEHYDMIFKQAPEDSELRTNLKKSAEQNQPTKHMKTAAPPPPVNQMAKTPVNQMAKTTVDQMAKTPKSAAMNIEPKSPQQYENVVSGLSYSQQMQQKQQKRGSVRSTGIYNCSYEMYNPQTNSSVNGSLESLNSTQSNHIPARRPYSRKGSESSYSNVTASELANKLMLLSSDVPSLSPVSVSMTGSVSVNMTGSVSGTLGNNTNNNTTPNRRSVRTLYHCKAENSSELSFEPNVKICNVRISKEPGWLEGCLDGKVGLIPENYVEYID